MDLNAEVFSKTFKKKRTAGDGMESVENISEANKISESKIDAYVQSSKAQCKLPTTRLIEVFATKSTTVSKKKLSIHSRNPRFVPYEPYPGAVKPILPLGKLKDSKKSKNNMDINLLIAQMSQMDTKLPEFKPRSKQNSQNEKQNMANEEWSQEKTLFQNKIESLTEENNSLREQLKQQVQVNKELKTMLVASMGEDLETQVQTLNDDKRELANALLSSAQHLSTHQEQTEWLAGQCEVWRSKFLASSLMVEELAIWKNLLTQRVNDSQNSIQQLLEERCRTRDMLICSYRNLYSLHERWLQSLNVSEYNKKPIGNLHFGASAPQTSNILDLASVNLKLSENIASNVDKCDVIDLSSLPCDTEAEKLAEMIISTPLELPRSTEAPVTALVSHAHRRSSTATPPLSACMHCKSKVQLL